MSLDSNNNSISPKEKEITNNQVQLSNLKREVETWAVFNTDKFIVKWNKSVLNNKIQKQQIEQQIYTELLMYKEFTRYVDKLPQEFNVSSKLVNFFADHRYFYNSNYLEQWWPIFHTVIQTIDIDQLGSLMNKIDLSMLWYTSKKLNFQGIKVLVVDDLQWKNNGYTIYNCIVLNRSQVHKIYWLLGLIDTTISENIVLTNELGNLIYNVSTSNYNSQLSELFSDYVSMQYSSKYVVYLAQLYVYVLATNQKEL